MLARQLCFIIKRKSQIEAYYSILNYVLRMLYCAKKLSVVSMPIIKMSLMLLKVYMESCRLLEECQVLC